MRATPESAFSTAPLVAGGDGGNHKVPKSKARVRTTLNQSVQQLKHSAVKFWSTSNVGTEIIRHLAKKDLQREVDAGVLEQVNSFSALTCPAEPKNSIREKYSADRIEK